MPKESRWRTRLTPNRSLLLLNTIFLCVNIICVAPRICHWLIPLTRSAPQAFRDAEKLNMDLYFAKTPFALLVAKTFPQENTFTFIDYGHRLLMSGEDADGDDDHGAARRKATITFGTASMSCYYSLDKGIRMNELEFATETQIITDLNADGFYDMRIPLDRKGILQVWYNDKWQDVIGGEGGKYQRHLRNDGVVDFDMQSGIWLSPTDAPPPGGN